MKFLSLFAAGVVAASVVERQSADVNSLISEIGTITGKVGSLTSAINAITGPESKDAVVASSQDVLNELATGTSVANGLAATLTLEQALSITPSVNALSSAVNTAIDAIIAKKDIIVASGLGGTTLAQLQQQQTAGQTFAAAITNKVPTAAAAIANQLSQPILDNLARGVAAFQGLTDSAPSGSSSASSSAAASTTVTRGSTTVAVTTTAPVSSSYGATTLVKPTVTVSKNGTVTSVPYTGAAATNAVGLGLFAAAALVAAF